MVAILGRIVQHGVVVDLFHLGHRAQVAGQTHGDLAPLRALQAEQVRDLEWLARVADVELRARLDRALVDAKDAELPDEGIDAHLEHVRDDVLGRIGGDLHRCGVGAFALEELSADCLPRGWA